MNEHTAAHTLPSDGDLSPLPERAETELATVPSRQQHSERQPDLQRILVVEDDLALALLEAEILTANGYTVSTVQSGELAISTLRHSLPDLVLLDLELTSTVNGWQVLQTLRSFATIPVLITSSSITSVRHYLQQCGETRGTLDHLPKPYPMQSLLKRVKRMLPINPT